MDKTTERVKRHLKFLPPPMHVLLLVVCIVVVFFLSLYLAWYEGYAAFPSTFTRRKKEK